MILTVFFIYIVVKLVISFNHKSSLYYFIKSILQIEGFNHLNRDSPQHFKQHINMTNMPWAMELIQRGH